MPLHQDIGNHFIELQQVESTNNYATGLIHAGMAQGGTVVFAHLQTAGKGQYGKQWFGEAGKNIAMSIVIQPSGLILSDAFLLSMATAIAVQELVQTYISSNTTIKWPNDIYWNDRKTAGILIENIIQGNDWQWSIIGIGININQTNFDPAIGNAVSIKQITGNAYDPVVLAKELCVLLQSAFTTLTQSSDAIAAHYQQLLYKRGEEVTLRKGSRIFKALIKEVCRDGRLIVQTAMEESFNVGEIEWVTKVP